MSYRTERAYTIRYVDDKKVYKVNIIAGNGKVIARNKTEVTTNDVWDGISLNSESNYFNPTKPRG